jgi:phosphate starvation-inducible protein PhoH
MMSSNTARTYSQAGILMTKKPRQPKRSTRQGRGAVAVVLPDHDLPHSPPTRAAKTPIEPLNKAQSHYMQAIAARDLVFCAGPAGTGKSYLSVGLAADALRDKEVDRIIITRPAVEAGEELGFSTITWLYQCDTEEIEADKHAWAELTAWVQEQFPPDERAPIDL